MIGRACVLGGLLVVVATATACGTPSGSGDRPDLTVFAAASLRDAIGRAAEAYVADVPMDIAISTGSSATLRTQIEQGAPADLFLSADLANPEALVDAGLTEGDVMPFAGNALTIIVPAADPGAVETPADLARPGVKIIAAGDDVPISRYAAQVVAALAGMAGYPPDFASAYRANVVSREDDVAAIVAKIELGEGDAGIVYATDAVTADGVRPIALPKDADVQAAYGGVVVEAADGTEAAQAFLEWLRGPAGREVLGASGFAPPPS